jgi:hypothetical protein
MLNQLPLNVAQLIQLKPWHICYALVGACFRAMVGAPNKMTEVSCGLAED